MPWPGDRAAAARAMGRFKFAAAPALYWLTDGLEDGQSKNLRDAFHRYGDATLFGPTRTALGLLPVTRDASGFAITATRASANAPLEVEAGAIGARGETLAATRIRFRRGDIRASGHIGLADGSAQCHRASGHRRRGTAPARCSCWTGARPSAAPASCRRMRLRRANRCSPTIYYLDRALSPYAEIAKGNISQLLDRHVSVLILADVAKISGDDLGKVKDFVSKGGMLIRFAGDHMTGGSDDLVPVHLRVGGRYLGSAMAWSSPQHLAPFGTVEPVQRPGNAVRSDGEPPGAGRAVGRAAGPHLGAAFRRHAADHRTEAWARAGSYCSTSPPANVVVAAAVGALCGHAQAPVGAVGGHAGARSGRTDQPAARVAAGRLRPSRIDARRRRTDRGQGLRPYPCVTAASTGSLRRA